MKIYNEVLEQSIHEAEQHNMMPRHYITSNDFRYNTKLAWEKVIGKITAFNLSSLINGNVEMYFEITDEYNAKWCCTYWLLLSRLGAVLEQFLTSIGKTCSEGIVGTQVCFSIHNFTEKSGHSNWSIDFHNDENLFKIRLDRVVQDDDEDEEYYEDEECDDSYICARFNGSIQKWAK